MQLYCMWKNIQRFLRELLSIVKFAIIFSSSAIEECYYMKKSLINIKIDNNDRYPFLKDKSNYIELEIENINKILKKSILKLNNK